MTVIDAPILQPLQVRQRVSKEWRAQHRARLTALEDQSAAAMSMVLKHTAVTLTKLLHDQAVTILAAAFTSATAGDLSVLNHTWQRQVHGVLIPTVKNAYDSGSQSAAEEWLGESAALVLSLATVQDALIQAAQSRIEMAANRLTGVGDQLWQSARDQLTEGFRLGESIPQLSDRVSAALDSTEARATTIARTEVISASNAGALDTMQALGPDGPPTKVWLATADGRTRESHADADGQSVPIDQQFEVGGDLLDFPGDPAGSDAEVINCRCTLTWDERAVENSCDLPAVEAEQAAADEMAASAELVADGCEPVLVDSSIDLQTGDERPANVTGSDWVGMSNQAWADALEPEQRAALNGYQYSTFAPINEGLRAGADINPGLMAEVQAIDSSMTATIPEDRMLFRAASSPDFPTDPEKASDLVGSRFTDPAYVSTSTNMMVAYDFATEGIVPQASPVIFAIEAPAGTRGAYLDLIENAQQKEFLLPRGQTFEITNTEKVQFRGLDSTRYYLKVVG